MMQKNNERYDKILNAYIMQIRIMLQECDTEEIQKSKKQYT